MENPPPPTLSRGRVLGEDNGNFHITWGPVISLSSMFPSGGKRESQGADNALSFTAWGSLWGLGPSSSCSLGPGLRSVSIGSSLKLGDSRAVSRGKGSSKSTSVSRPWFVTCCLSLPSSLCISSTRVTAENSARRREGSPQPGPYPTTNLHNGE